MATTSPRTDSMIPDHIRLDDHLLGEEVWGRSARQWLAWVVSSDGRVIDQRAFVTSPSASYCPRRDEWVASWGPIPVKEEPRQVTETAGRIIETINHGTIVTVILLGEDDRSRAVHFDHRQFAHMFEAEAADLIGRNARLVEAHGVQALELD